jgi:hypothetical protein
MQGPLLPLSQPLRRMEIPLAAQPFKSSDALFHHRDNAQFAFKALTGCQIISGLDQTALRLFRSEERPKAGRPRFD